MLALHERAADAPARGARMTAEAVLHQCLDRRMESIAIVAKECSAWDCQRNQEQKGVDWQFTTADARVKLKRLYPQVKV